MKLCGVDIYIVFLDTSNNYHYTLLQIYSCQGHSIIQYKNIRTKVLKYYLYNQNTTIHFHTE
jgi:hypothetical protein